MFKVKKKTIEAEFELVTPAFIGGADQDRAELRPPSIKGALRFWWRALRWSPLRSAHADDAAALGALHREEADLFGSASEEEGSGQGRFLLTVRPSNGALTSQRAGTVHPKFKDKDAARYLGYGLMEAFASSNKNTQAGQLVRGCIDENQSFVVKLVFRETVDDSVKEAVIALGLLGGLGSRARHGLGSLRLKVLKGDSGDPIWQAPANRAEYIGAVKKLLADKYKLQAEPPYSAFCRRSRVDILPNMPGKPCQYNVLEDFARNLLMYRSWGKHGKVLGKDSEKRFEQDHDWKYRKTPITFHPRRVVFGLPHNYGKEDSLQIISEHYDRRASPLFFHVHALGDGSFLGVTIYLRSKFLPDGERINAGGNMVNANIEWEVLTDFLDGSDKAGKGRFSGKTTLAVRGAS